MSKLHGEKAVRTFCPEHWIVRTGWLFGGGEKDMKFVARILRKISLDHEIKVVRDCVGSPTFTVDLASGLLELVRKFQYGTYHLVNGGIPTSRYELAIETMKIAGYPEDLIIPCLSSDFHLPAPRPRMEAASSLKLNGTEKGLVLPHWKESLSGYVRGELRALIQ
jgi:dTDP-4-dehydrorhamnose reductase